MKLGKQEFKHDDRTLQLANFFGVLPPTPDKFDWDAHRKPLPKDNAWGNFDYGDCVLGTRANDLVRKERFETRRTVPLTAEMVIAKYKEMTGCVSPGDQNDTGLVMLDANNDWRAGWELPVYHGRKYTIDAYGFLRATDHEALRAAIFLLGGIQLGLALPLSARSQVNSGTWDVVDGPESEPGSWGGHAVFCKHYDQGGIWCITWDQEVYMTNAFVDKYADEAWGTVDSLETHSRYLDVEKLKQYLRDIGASHIG